MPSWLERWEKRHRELAEGADTELMQANRRRFRLAFALIGVGFALAVLGGKLHLPSTFDAAVRVIAGAAVVIGFVLGRWARQEREFLTQPDPEGPPEIFRDTHNQR